MDPAFPLDFSDVTAVGFQISADGKRVWLCINGQCVVRVKGINGGIDLTDDRPLCSSCKGKGQIWDIEDDDGYITCPKCGGKGK